MSITVEEQKKRWKDYLYKAKKMIKELLEDVKSKES